jgi:hypothetical protein
VEELWELRKIGGSQQNLKVCDPLLGDCSWLWCSVNGRSLGELDNVLILG